MAAEVGRTTHIGWGNASPQAIVAGVREKSVTLSGEAVDITNDDSLGWRELLAAQQVNTIEISCSGVCVDDTLRQAWFAGNAARMEPASFIYPDGGRIAGNFWLQDYSETGATDDALTFEATFQSSGVITYTPGA